MRNGTADRVTLNTAAQTTLRILIASYFMAVAMRIIPGTNLALLFSWAVEPTIATALSAAVVFLLSFMVMTAIYTRVAALILGMMVFYASYLTMVELGVERELGGFWRDLALISALLLTYNDTNPNRRSRRAPIHRRVAPRRVASIMARAEAAGGETSARPAPDWANAPAPARAPGPSPFSATRAAETGAAPRRKNTQAILERASHHMADVPAAAHTSRPAARGETPADEPEIDNIFSDGDCLA